MRAAFFLPLCCLIASTSPLPGAEPLLKLSLLKLKSGEEYTNVEVTAKEADGIRITHSAGLRRVPAAELPREVLDKLGPFDPAAAAAAMKKREEAANAARSARTASETDRLIEVTTYGPVAEYVEKRKDNVPPDEAAKYKKAKELLAQLKAVCDPMIARGRSRTDVTAWCGLVWRRQVDVGMPEPLLLLSWGQPDTLNRSSSGSHQWIYDRGDFNRQYVYVKDGFVSSWSD